jgi:hypothetical protein
MPPAVTSQFDSSAEWNEAIEQWVAQCEAGRELETKIIRFPTPMRVALQSESQTNAHLRSATGAVENAVERFFA